jgi:hypothetical protein
VVGAAEEDGALGELEEEEDEGADGDEEEEVGAAALRLVLDIKEMGPELNRIAERETTITRDKIRVFLSIVTFVLLLPAFFFSSPSAVPAIY